MLFTQGPIDFWSGSTKCPICKKGRKWKSFFGHVTQCWRNIYQKEKCQICKKVFKSGKKGLVHHMNTYHQDQKQYICQKPLCDKIFNTEDDLIEHVKKCFCCSKCGKYFGSVEGLKSHQFCELSKITKVKSDNASVEPETLSKSHFAQCREPDLIKGVQSNAEKSDQELKEILDDEIIPVETEEERNFNHTTC